MNEFVDSLPLLGDAQSLQERFARDGYVYCRGLLDPQPLLALRRQIVELCAQHGWLKPGTDPMDAIAWTRPRVEGEEAYFEVYDALQRLQDFHGLAHQADIMRLMRALLGDTAFPHPLSVGRLVFPENHAWTTPPHQDYPNNQGTPELYACWVPLSDCPQAMGSLAILPGSHRFGLLPLDYALGAGHRQARLPQEAQGIQWAASDFKLGDVVVFHSLTVHRSLDNTSDRMRLSVDYRYQAEGQDITESCLHPHFQRESWADIYRGWDRDELKYYWRDKDFNIVAWNDQLSRLPEDHMAQAVRMQREFDSQRDALARKYSAGEQ